MAVELIQDQIRSRDGRAILIEDSQLQEPSIKKDQIADIDGGVGRHCHAVSIDTGVTRSSRREVYEAIIHPVQRPMG